MSLCVHVGIQVGELFANGPKQLCFEPYVQSQSTPSPIDSKSNQGYVRVGPGPECHSRP